MSLVADVLQKDEILFLWKVNVLQVFPSLGTKIYQQVGHIQNREFCEILLKTGNKTSNGISA